MLRGASPGGIPMAYAEPEEPYRRKSAEKGEWSAVPCALHLPLPRTAFHNAVASLSPVLDMPEFLEERGVVRRVGAGLRGAATIPLPAEREEAGVTVLRTSVGSAVPGCDSTLAELVELAEVDGITDAAGLDAVGLAEVEAVTGPSL